MSKTDKEKMLETEEKKKIKIRFLTLFNMVKEIDKSLDVSQARLAKKFHVSEQTFKDTYNAVDPEKATNCNPVLVINFAHQYGIDPYDIMFSDIPVKNLFEDIKANMHDKDRQSRKKAQLRYDERICPLSSETHGAYFGVFYGYTISHHPDESHIIRFILHIFETDTKEPIAEYSFYDANNKKRVFTGIPYCIAKRNAIAIEMTDKNSGYQYLYFNGAAHSAPLFTYKSGVCVRTSSASSLSEPEIRSFVITPHELPEEIIKKYIPGLLKLTGDDFYILKSDLNKLEAENPELAKFRGNNKNAFIPLTKSVYLVKERSILCGIERSDINSHIFAFKCLTEMKAYALAASRITYRYLNADYYFFKELSEKLHAEENRNTGSSQ